jgi:hypothetical protein
MISAWPYRIAVGLLRFPVKIQSEGIGLEQQSSARQSAYQHEMLFPENREARPQASSGADLASRAHPACAELGITLRAAPRSTPASCVKGDTELPSLSTETL